MLAFWLYRFEISIRASAILGLIGAGGIGKMLIDNIGFRVWNVVGTLMIVAVVVTMIIDQVSGTVRNRIITGRWQLPIVTAISRRRTAVRDENCWHRRDQASDGAPHRED